MHIESEKSREKYQTRYTGARTQSMERVRKIWERGWNRKRVRVKARGKKEEERKLIPGVEGAGILFSSSERVHHPRRCWWRAEVPWWWTWTYPLLLSFRSGIFSFSRFICSPSIFVVSSPLSHSLSFHSQFILSVWLNPLDHGRKEMRRLLSSSTQT